MDTLLSLLEDAYGDEDELIDLLQELEPAELEEICKASWVLELILAYCKRR